ncbi:release factor glutamine methyltransferase [Nocardia caishijiensis]|uniref:peptide chain release factor N(5)-glutamine methyltransferase n=1 Tax=Nocardia caishijiensis TaxID=184756 RepID=A0ABQ6YN87_9NOCA|nr:release factor glutamine methyltransferase [Nocardia caishijiensis]
MFAEDEAALLIESAGGEAGLLEGLVARRVSGVPLEYLLGWVEFRGVRVGVRAGVFVPRQRTAFLVERAVTGVVAESVRIVDLCCGCGALGLIAATELAGRGCSVELVAADLDPAAVACARENLAPLGAAVYAGDLFDALPTGLRGRIDVLLANTPYVPSARIAELPPEAREHEPLVALDGGDDGLAVFRRVAEGAARWLAPGGSVYVEAGKGQVETALAVLREHGLAARAEHSEEYYATVVTGTRRE